MFVHFHFIVSKATKEKGTVEQTFEHEQGRRFLVAVSVCNNIHISLSVDIDIRTEYGFAKTQAQQRTFRFKGCL